MAASCPQGGSTLPQQPATAAPGAARPGVHLVADGALLLITVAWGATFVAVKDAVASVPVFTFLTLRFGLAGLVLGAWLAARRAMGRRGAAPAGGGAKRPGRPGPTSRLAVMARGAGPGLAAGGLLFAGYALQTLGLRFTTPGKAGFITGLSVVLVPILDALVFRRPQERAAVLGAVVAAAGAAAMFAEPADLAVRRGDLLVLGCAAAFGGHVVAVGRLGPRSDAAGFALWQVVAVTALSAAAALVEGWDAGPVDAQVAGTLLLTGPLVSGLLLVVQAWGQRHTSPAHAAVIFAAEPIFAAAFGAAMAGERFGARALAGGSLILAGMLAAELERLFRGLRRARPWEKGLRAASRTP